MRKLTQLFLTDDEAERTIAALEASQEHDLAAKISRSLELSRRQRRAEEEAQAELERYRAERAKNHVLTKRQAECMVAVREGQYPYMRPYTWTGEDGVVHVRWQSSRSMGGAANRMISTLVDEGMLTERGWQLTDAGRERLAAWEAKNGPIIPEGAVVR